MDVSLGYILAWIGIALMLGLSGAGAGIGFGGCCSAVLGVLKKRPEAFGTVLILSAIPSTQGLYGFVAFIMYSNAVGALGPEMSTFQGAVALGAGIAVALACFVTCVYQARIAANGIIAVGAGHNAFGPTMIMAAFPEFYAILSLIGAILMLPLLS